MKGMKIFMGVVGVFVTLPIWFYLVYSILCAIHPDRLVWFLFWIYIPTNLLMSILAVVVNANGKK